MEKWEVGFFFFKGCYQKCICDLNKDGHVEPTAEGHLTVKTKKNYSSNQVFPIKRDSLHTSHQKQQITKNLFALKGNNHQS